MSVVLAGLALVTALHGAESPIVQGKQVFDRWCSACHGRGDAYPGTNALNAKYKGTIPGVLEDRRDLTVGTIKYYVRNGVSIMPFFRKTEISDAELKTLIAYLTAQKRKPR